MKHVLAIPGLTLMFGLVLALLTSLSNGYQPKLIGVYDPSNTFQNVSRLSFQASFFDWHTSSNTVRKALRANALLHRTSLVTLEPWPNTGEASSLLADISAGRYDAITDNACKAIGTSQQPVLIRWGHEMEQVTSRYPWAGKDPTAYITAYQHFVTRCRLSAPHVTFVWSPAGDLNAERYWPGSDYVDVVGVSMYDFDLWDQEHLGSIQTFDTLFDPKYNRVKSFGKPLLIAELGVTGSSSAKTAWLANAMESLPNYKQLFGLVYFNAQDTNAWESNLPVPDWRIDPRALLPLIPSQPFPDYLQQIVK